jgi:hypothetical protein
MVCTDQEQSEKKKSYDAVLELIKNLLHLWLAGIALAILLSFAVIKAHTDSSSAPHLTLHGPELNILLDRKISMAVRMIKIGDYRKEF